MSDWRPIETAPLIQDLLVYGISHNNISRQYIAYQLHDGTWHREHYGGRVPVNPTHWMPLPDPPHVRKDPQPLKDYPLEGQDG